MIAIIGCGNPSRQDDGVGPEVIRMLKQRRSECGEIKLLDTGTDGMAVMFAARGCTSLIVIDAASGADPGAVYQVPGDDLARSHAHGLNLHDFGWQAALHAGRQMFREAFPVDVTVFLIGAQSLGFGIGLSGVVAASAHKVASRIEALIAERLAQVRA